MPSRSSRSKAFRMYFTEGEAPSVKKIESGELGTPPSRLEMKAATSSRIPGAPLESE